MHEIPLTVYAFFPFADVLMEGQINPARLQGQVGLTQWAPSSPVVTLSPSVCRAAARPPCRELLAVFHSVLLQGGSPTAPRAEDHYVA